MESSESKHSLTEYLNEKDCLITYEPFSSGVGNYGLSVKFVVFGKFLNLKSRLSLLKWENLLYKEIVKVSDLVLEQYFPSKSLCSSSSVTLYESYYFIIYSMKKNDLESGDLHSLLEEKEEILSYQIGSSSYDSSSQSRQEKIYITSNFIHWSKVSEELQSKFQTVPQFCTGSSSFVLEGGGPTKSLQAKSFVQSRRDTSIMKSDSLSCSSQSHRLFSVGSSSGKSQYQSESQDKGSYFLSPKGCCCRDNRCQIL